MPRRCSTRRATCPTASDELPALTTGALLEVEDLHYSYDADAPLLRGVDFDVRPGRTVALVGATASGKSTLTSLMTRLVDPDAGRIRIDGHDLKGLRKGALPRDVALVPQTAFMFDDTVRGNVTLGADVPDADVWAALRTAQADGFVAALPDGIDTKLGERGTSLSGGQRQRLSLARALVRRPRLLILDDATSAVDPEVEARILASLRDDRDEGGDDSAASLVVVAYRKATISLADEVLHLEDGRIVGRGTHAELLATSPAYAQLVNAYETDAALDADAGSATDAAEATAGPMSAVAPTSGTRMDTGEDIGAMATLRLGMKYSPELREGLGLTLFFAVIASCGQIVVPIAVQQTLDRGLNGPGGPRLDYVVWMGVLAAFAIAVTSWASYLMTSRLFTTSERGLATLRTKAFRHVHDLPLLTQNTERRGALVSRVTSDVDQVSQFLVFGGLIFVVSIGQMLVATVLMVVLQLAARAGGLAVASRRCSSRSAGSRRSCPPPTPSYATRSACCSAPSPSRSSAPPSSAPTASRTAPRRASTPPSRTGRTPTPTRRPTPSRRSPSAASRPAWPTPA